MFQWDKTVTSIPVPATQVVNLFRSMREVQLALPGVSAQQASAYLCQYRQDDGITTVAVFHLQKSHVLAFYFGDPRVVQEAKLDSMLDQGLNFVESMGFLMTDQDIHLLDEADQRMLWESLPLYAGLATVEEQAPSQKPAEKPVAKAATKTAAASADAPKTAVPPESSAHPAAATQTPVEEPAAAPEGPEPAAKPDTATKPDTAAKPDAGESVDDLLAAVEAMRAKRPGLRARKTAPSPEEMNRRKDQLRETVGRILATL